MEKSIHDGHRQRIRDKIDKMGTDVLNDHEFLEYMLFFAIPRGDTNPLAHRLIEHFGGLRGVIEASPLELSRVEGVGPKTARFLSSFLPVIRRYLESEMKEKKVLESRSQVIDYFKALAIGYNYEVAFVMYLNKNKNVIQVKKISEGNADSTSIYPDRIIEEAILRKAYYVAVAHNHPSGNLMTSSNDIEITRELVQGLANVKKKLVDSIILNGTSYFSLYENGFLENISIFNPMEPPPKFKPTDNTKSSEPVKTEQQPKPSRTLYGIPYLSEDDCLFDF